LIKLSIKQFKKAIKLAFLAENMPYIHIVLYS